MLRSVVFGIAVLFAFPVLCAAADTPQSRAVGVAKIDITPDYPIRLTGYAARKGESEGVAQRIYAKALAFGSDQDGPALLITADNCGVPRNVREEVVKRLRKRGIEPARVAICSSHTHSAPWLKGYLSNLFAQDLPEDQRARIDRYTAEFTDALVKAAEQALRDRQPASITRGKGQAGFAANRRTKGGPVDHDLPLLFVTDAKGKLRAVFGSYACHCTTLTGEFNQICGDWAGYAQEYLERDHPGAVALMALGCGGDANPNPRPGFDLAKKHGQEIATSAGNVLSGSLSAVAGPLTCRTKEIVLPLRSLPSRAELEARGKETNHAGRLARLDLARLDRGQAIAASIPYMVQTWSFGDSLTMVFLPGEVVVDYSLRLKKELDASRLWVNAYANDVPCYIPSERVLKEGGYEGALSMVYYAKESPFAPGLENLIVSTVHELTPAGLRQGAATTAEAKKN